MVYLIKIDNGSKYGNSEIVKFENREKLEEWAGKNLKDIYQHFVIEGEQLELTMKRVFGLLPLKEKSENENPAKGDSK